MIIKMQVMKIKSQPALVVSKRGIGEHMQFFEW
jgi:hypothetical protein